MDWMTGTWYCCDDCNVSVKNLNAVKKYSSTISHLFYVEKTFYRATISEELKLCINGHNVVPTGLCNTYSKVANNVITHERESSLIGNIESNPQRKV